MYSRKFFRDCLVLVRLDISNLKVNKNRYSRGDVLPDNDCPFCPGFEDNELHLFFVHYTCSLCARRTKE